MDRYGDHDLQLNDRDNHGTANNPVWGGVAVQQPQGQAAVAPNNNQQGVNQVATPRYVFRLQEDLRELGFLIVPAPSGNFDLRTEWGVREFQIYAKMSHVAQEDIDPAVAQNPYLDRLSQVSTGSNGYTGPVSGVVNQDTRAAIQHWLDNHWRCPVVIQARSGTGFSNIFQGHENIWRHDEVGSSTPRMFARDFTTYYTFPAGRNASDLIVVGDHQSYLQWDGPRSIPPRHTWSDAELLPEHLVGTAQAQLTAPQLSTYKVVRAVSEVECIGFFDSVNCYDNAFLSLGPCHWTLGIVSGTQVDEGELCGYLSYLRHADPGSFRDAIEFFGARIDEDWVHNGVGDGHNLKGSSARKYVGWPAQQRDDQSFARMTKDEAHGNYFKTWHWMYRFVMAGRTIEGYRRRMWHMARVRIRDIRAIEWSNVQPAVANVGNRAPTIGDVFTSERAMGIILRWHIRSPGSMISGGAPGPRIRGALGRARQAQQNLNWNGDPSTWVDGHEAALVQGLMDEAQANAQNYFNTLNYVNNWPNSWGNNPRGFALNAAIGRLANTRGSLNFADSDLPPAPAW
jgi:hypothetical protein